MGWAAFWSVVLVTLAGRAREWAAEQRKGATLRHFAFGLVGGLAVLTRPSFLPFVLLTTAWLAWSARSGGTRRALRHSSLAVAGFLALTLPTALASSAIADHPSFLPRAGSLNLYLGNHPDRCTTLRIRPGQQWVELRRLLAGEVSSAGDGPGVFRARVVQFAMEDPASFGAGILHKLGQLTTGREIPRNLDIYLFGQWSPLLAALVWKAGPFGFPFGLLFPAAALGLWLRRKDVPTPLALLVLSYPLVIAATFVAGRYRAPLVPLLSILAAAGVIEVVRRVRHRDWKAALAPLAVGAALFACTLRPDPFCEEEVDFHSEMYAFVAMDAARAKDTVYAEYLYEKALTINPSSARTHEAFADFWAGEQNLGRAIEHYDQAILISEDYWVYPKRGGVHFVMNDLSRALADYDRSIALDPKHSPAYLGRASVYYRRGDVGRALVELRHALKSATSKQEAATAQAAFEFMSANR